MLVLKLVEKSAEKYVYNYHPEDGEVYGVIEIDSMTGEIKVSEIASNDKHRRYLSHAVRAVERFLENSSYPENHLSAWY